MDAGQITIMPAVGGSSQASALPVAGASGASTGLFGEMLGQNILGLQGSGTFEQNGDQAETVTTDIIAALTKELVEQEAISTELDPTAVSQLAAYAQLALIQTTNLPIVQQQVATTVVAPPELQAVTAPAASRSEAQLTGADLAGSAVSVNTMPSEQVMTQNLVDIPKEFAGMQNGAQPEVMSHSESGATAKMPATPNQMASSNKLQTATMDAPVEPVQQQEISLKAELEKQVQKNQVSGQQVAQQSTEATPVTQEVAGTVKPTATVVQQPVRFAQHPDVVAAAAGSEGQKNAASDQQDQGSQMMAKTPKELIMQGEQVKPELVENVGTTFRLSEQHAVSMHTGQPVVVATDGATAELVKNVPQELIGRQVTDRLASHEIKQGNDQISLKLSPENLGNLQLNMRMDDNRLKLEIVAETRGVRDALLQQADELKETLARQNIKVDSFSVTTNNNGNQSQQQSADWRQMTQEQRQYQPQYASLRTGGGAGDGVGTTMQYFAPQYQSTIDVRF